MEQIFVFNTIEIAFMGAVSILFTIQLLYYLVIYARPIRTSAIKMPLASGGQPPVSVIVYAKNESENLEKYLPSLLTQDYPDYEIIVVNDGSTDESDNVLKAYENEYKHLYHTYIPEDVKYLSRKKLALTVGIKAAKNEILLFTEANCYPLSNRWIHAMAKAYQPTTSIVLGYCAYGNHKGFLHKLIAYDNLLSGIQYISSALAQHPYTGNGRNLSYTKDLFFKHKGYYKSLNLHAGDDDLFINESASKNNTIVEYSADSITEMAKIEYFKIWKEMKVSRAATRRFYKGKRLMFYRMETMSFFLFLAFVIASIIFGIQSNWLITIWGILLYIILFITKAAILHKSAKLLQQKPLTGWLPFIEIVQPIFNLYVRIYRIFRGKNDYTFRLGK
ncbi:glycosyltransferase [Parabacteroides chinchillae]